MTAPNLSFNLFFAAFLGAALLWLSTRYGKTILISLDDFIDELSDDFKIRTIVSLFVCSILGAILAVYAAEPGTVKQAFAAGLGWSGLVGSLTTGSVKRSKVK